MKTITLSPVSGAVFAMAGGIPHNLLTAEAVANHYGFATADRDLFNTGADDVDPATLSDADLERAIARFEQLVNVIDGDGRTLTPRQERRLDAAEEQLAMLRAEQTGRQPRARRTEPDGGGRDRGANPNQTRAQAEAGARSSSRQSLPAQPRDPRDRATNGFVNFGDFAASVHRAAVQGGLDPRLIANAPTTSSSEGVGQDGGFAVPPDFRAAIMAKVAGEESLLAMTDQQVSSSNSITFPADETTPWQNSGGIQAFWEGEGQQLQQSKSMLTDKTVKTSKVTALVPVTSELLDDAPALASYLDRKAPEKMQFKVNDAIFNGTGVGMPLGILQSAGTVVVAAEGSQTADTVNFANIQKLWAAVTPAGRRGGYWFLNADVEPQLQQLAFPGAGTAVPAYMPPGGLSAAPYGTLLGRPIIFTEAMQALGDKGDIVFGDLKNYLTVVKAGGVRADVSIHLWFDYDTSAFRFILRVGGQPWWNTTIAPNRVGSTARGFFATLAARP